MTFGSVLLGETLLYWHETRISLRNARVFAHSVVAWRRWSALLSSYQEADYRHVIVGSHHHIFLGLRKLGNPVQSLAKLHCEPQNLLDGADVSFLRHRHVHMVFLNIDSARKVSITTKRLLIFWDRMTLTHLTQRCSKISADLKH